MNPYRGLQSLENLPPWDGKRLCRIETAASILAELGNPQDQVKAVHVAGTNGKGSVCSLTAACLWASGQTVGQFASPHLSHVTERCLINGVPVSIEEFDRALKATFAACKRLEVSPSYFVAGMISSFLVFAERKLDWMVIEVGVGGTWDATNTIAAPRASVITHIGFDHTHLLGETLPEIAGNKAGIIKPGCPVFVGANEPEVIAVCQEKAEALGAPLSWFGGEFHFDHERSQLRWSEGAVSLPPEATKPRARLENTCLALRVAASLGCAADALERGLRAVRWPGRLEKFSVETSRGVSTTVAIDGMHNVDGTPVTVEFLHELVRADASIQHLTVVFAMRSGKDWSQVLELLLQGVAGLPRKLQSVSWICTGSDLPGMQDPALLGAQLERTEQVAVVPNSQDALQEALRRVADDRSEAESLVLITGSLYLLGELRPLISTEPFRTIDPLA